MSRGYRHILAAFAGLITVTGLFYAGHDQLQSADHSSQPDYEYQPARDHLARAPGKDANVTAYPYQPYCDEPKDTEDADLCAQWAAVAEAREGNRLTRATISITTLEFMALVVTVFFTGWAAVAAATASKAANASLKVFMRAERGEVVASVQWEAIDSIVVKFMNRGRSQAYVTHIDYQVFTEPPTGKIAVVLTRPNLYPLTLVASGDEITEGPFGLPAHPHIWIAGGVLFKDVFNRMDYSPFAVAIDRAAQTITAYTKGMDFSEWREWAERANKGKKPFEEN